MIQDDMTTWITDDAGNRAAMLAQRKVVA